MDKLEVESQILSPILADPAVKTELNSAAINLNFALVSTKIELDLRLSLFKLTQNLGYDIEQFVWYKNAIAKRLVFDKFLNVFVC